MGNSQLLLLNFLLLLFLLLTSYFLILTSYFSRFLPCRPDLGQHFLRHRLAIFVGHMQQADAICAPPRHHIGHLEIAKRSEKLPAPAVKFPDFELFETAQYSCQLPVSSCQLPLIRGRAIVAGRIEGRPWAARELLTTDYWQLTTTLPLPAPRRARACSSR
jgi:hypothetical protein